MTTVLVTGASGLPGSHVLRELHVAAGLVRGLSRRPETDAAITTLGAEPRRGDLDEEARQLCRCARGRAHMQPWQRGCFRQDPLLGGEHTCFVDFARRVGERLGRESPARPLQRRLLMGIARASDARGRLRGRGPDVTPEGAAPTSHRLQVDAGRALRELGHRMTPPDALHDRAEDSGDEGGWVASRR